MCAKNLGERFGINMYISYGPKEAGAVPSGVLEEKSDEKAMDYSINKGRLSLFLFNGSVEVTLKEERENSQSFTNNLESAGSTIYSIFESSIPYGDTLGKTLTLFKTLNAIQNEGSLESCGEAQVSTYWSRIKPDGSGDKGEKINDVVFNKGRPSWSVWESKDVDVGYMFAVYTDISTRFQQESHGYLDWWGVSEADEYSVKVYLNQDPEKKHPYFRLRSR